MSQTARVLSGLVAGILAGMLLAWQAPALGLQVAGIVQPFGTLWLNALQMTVVPLVLALVIVGINQASDAAQSGRVARRALIVFVVLLTAAASMAALLAPLALSQFTPAPELAGALRGNEAELPTQAGQHARGLAHRAVSMGMAGRFQAVRSAACCARGSCAKTGARSRSSHPSSACMVSGAIAVQPAVTWPGLPHRWAKMQLPAPGAACA